jgi:hypothetical protein
MRTFHHGGLTLPIEEVSRLFVKGHLPDGRGLDDVYASDGAQGLFDAVIPLMLKTYGTAVAPVHFEVLLRAMLQGGNIKGLREVALDWKRRGILAAASYQELKRVLLEALEAGGPVDELSSPKSWVMVGRLKAPC